jgi:integrase
VPLAAITATTIAGFQRARHEAGIANRTINMDVGVLSRVLKSCGRWRALADHVRNLPERQHPVGRALTAEEQTRLFAAAASNQEWEHVYCAAIVAANTSMRPVEVKHLRRRDMDLVRKLLFVRRSKNESSHRVIPLNASAVEAAARMFERADLLGHTEPEHYLWPACQWGRYDPTKPMLKWDTAWRALRDAAGLHGLRFHDLRQHAGHHRACRNGLGAATAQTATESRQVMQKSRRSWRSLTTSRHSHVTVCFCRARRPPVNC